MKEELEVLRHQNERRHRGGKLKFYEERLESLVQRVESLEHAVRATYTA